MSHSSKRRKTLIEQVKLLRRLPRIPNRASPTVPDKAMVAYFMTPNSLDETRRARQ